MSEIKQLLKKYKYPPEGQEKALEVVMAQCNRWADDDDNLTYDQDTSAKIISMPKPYPAPEDNEIKMAAEEDSSQHID